MSIADRLSELVKHMLRGGMAPDQLSLQELADFINAHRDCDLSRAPYLSGGAPLPSTRPIEVSGFAEGIEAPSVPRRSKKK